MKVVILAGGYGSRLEELTNNIPKPMVKIGPFPILHHIMNIYSSFGFNEFILALGYKGEVIKNYFLNYKNLINDISIDFASNEILIHNATIPNWKVHLVDTGLETQTGGRIKRLKSWVGLNPFMLTYGDGLANINLDELVAFHRAHGRIATVTAVRPSARFGNLGMDNTKVNIFAEKTQTNEGWINGGFFVFEPEIFDYLPEEDTPLERHPLEQLATAGELHAFKHGKFWQSMDTIREVNLLRDLWQKGNAPWV